MNGTAASSLISLSMPPAPVAPRTRLLLQAPIVPTLLRLAAPNVLNLLAFVGLITFDGLFVGRLGPDALAGISLVFPWVMLMQHGAASGMGGAVSSAVARALGAGKKDRANELATHAVWLALILTALFSCVMLVAGPTIYRAMGGRGPILEAAIAYSTVAFGGAISIWMLNLLANVVRGTGNMTVPATVIVGGVLGHIAISPMLIFGFGPIPALGPAGAGWGLVTSFGLGSVFLLGYLRSRRSLVVLKFDGVRFQWALLREFFHVGVPGMMNVGIGTAIVAMVGTNFGAKQYVRARSMAWSGGAVVATFCGAVGVFFALFPRLWMTLFTTDEEIIRVGVSYLQIVGPSYALYGLGIGMYFACQGYGKLLLAVAANAARLLLAAGGGLIVMGWIGAGPTGIFVAIACGFAAYAVFTTVALARIRTNGSMT